MTAKITKLNKINDFYVWSSERSLNDSLRDNIEVFMRDIFGEKVKSATDKKSEIIKTVKLKSGQYSYGLLIKNG
jgi:hypothetical protein